MHDFVQPYRDHSCLAVSIYHEDTHAQHVIVRANDLLSKQFNFFLAGTIILLLREFAAMEKLQMQF